MSQDFYGDHDAGPEWATPGYIWKPLSQAIGGFDLDPAAGCEKSPIASEAYTLNREKAGIYQSYTFTDGLETEWHGDVWVNPPYGRKFNDKWAQRIVKQARRSEVRTVTALLGVSTSTDRWHKGEAPLSEADLFTFLDHRVAFEGEMNGNASFPSVILTFGVENVNAEYIEALRELGLVVEPVESTEGGSK